MSEGKGFETVIASPPDYENLVAEIYLDGLFVVLISQEEEKGRFSIETPGCDMIESEIIRKVELRDFLKAIEMACMRLRGESP